MAEPKTHFSSKSSTSVAVIVFLILVLLGTFLAMQTVKTFVEIQEVRSDRQSARTIVAEGQARVSAKPTKATVRLGVESVADTTTAAQKDNTEKMNAITAQMEDLGIAEEDMQTEQYMIYEKQRYNPETGRTESEGWAVKQTLVVTTNAFDIVPEILTRATEFGVTQLQGPNFTFEDQTELKALARKEAIERAQAQAEGVAASLDVRLGKVIDYEEGHGGYLPYAAMERSMGSADSAMLAPDIQPGENEVSVTVYITYKIK